MEDQLSELKKVVEELRNEVSRLRGTLLLDHHVMTAVHRLKLTVSDQEEIRKLQYKYGYYLDKCLYKEVRKINSEYLTDVR
jgi:hypothetical protein